MAKSDGFIFDIIAAGTSTRNGARRVSEYRLLAHRVISRRRSNSVAFGAKRTLFSAGATDLMFVSHGLGNLIVLFDRVGRAEAAATLNGTLSKTFEFNLFVPQLPEAVTRLREALGETTFDAAVRRGAAMALHEAYDYAIDQVEQTLAAS